MRRVFALVACSVVLVAASTVMASDLRVPRRYAPSSLDQGLVQVVNPADGALWSAWAYRNGAEYDIAVSVRDGRGLWSEPTLIGLDDGRDQIRPAITADALGNLYLAFADRSSGGVHLSYRTPLAEAWSEPVRVNPQGLRGSAPALRVVGDRLVVAFRTGSRVEMLDLPLIAPGGSIDDRYTRDFQDGPDPVGASGGDQRETPPPPDEDREQRSSRGSGPVLYDGSEDQSDSRDRL